MAWDIRSTYYYLVCFATLLMVIIGGTLVVQRSLDLLLPTESYRPTVAEMEMRTQVRPGAEGTSPTVYTREEIEEMAREEGERLRRDEQRRTIRSLLGNLALVLIAAPVYLYHWRQVRRAP